MLTKYFKNESRAALWLDTKNPTLGNQRPIEMIKNGRSKKLLDFIRIAINENKK